MSSLSKLENLDLSNNRLTSLGSLELSSMHKLQNLYLQGIKFINSHEFFTGCHSTSSSLTSSSSNSRCFTRKSGKRWKRRYYLPQKARQERLNNSRKWKGVDHTELLSKKMHRISESGNLDSLPSESCTKLVSDNANLNGDDKSIFSEQSSANEKIIDSVIKNQVLRMSFLERIAAVLKVKMESSN
ncbi:hypothetical protein L6164_025731 [Bauhinia variegata]|uniref:Uncharacterized protein n=1 Tax=Bauhinia variegata TaxID=167791 RepID=A0ACB9M1E3_BAUVA|nr:hypothetical protein L6164_025731 [Bauhinia variegata]